MLDGLHFSNFNTFVWEKMLKKWLQVTRKREILYSERFAWPIRVFDIVYMIAAYNKEMSHPNSQAIAAAIYTK
jgi:hypothetical protein